MRMKATAEGMIEMTAEEEAAFNAEVGQTIVPAQVTALQALLAINAAGLASAYESWANNQSRTFAEKAANGIKETVCDLATQVSRLVANTNCCGNLWWYLPCTQSQHNRWLYCWCMQRNSAHVYRR